MPAHYFFLDDCALLVTTYWGRTNPQVSQEVREARAADPNRTRARGHLIDLSNLEETIWPAQSEAETFRSLGTSYPTIFGPLPTAVLATAAHIVGLARIFQISAGLKDPAVPVRVVGSVEEAAAFLGLELDAAMLEIARVQSQRS